MANRKSAIPFSSTPEQDQKLEEVLQELRGTQGAVMPALQKAQEIYGYLPIEVQQRVATGLNVPLEEVYGVSTFYSQFTLNPKGQYKVSVCLGTACYVKGSGDIYNALKEKLTASSRWMPAGASAPADWHRSSPSMMRCMDG